MATLRIILLVIFVLDSILLVIAVLLQSGRGGGLAGALGGISSADSALGVRAASQIEKATGVLAAIFFGIALILAFMAIQQSRVAGTYKIGETPSTFSATEPGSATTPAEATTPAGTTPAEATTPAAAISPPAETTVPAITKPATETTAPASADRS